MREPRSWIVIPALAVAAAAVAALVMHSAAAAIGAGLLAAALAAAIRAVAGDGGPAAIAAGAGAALGVLGWISLGGAPRDAIAGAAAMFAICELVRPRDAAASPWPAVGAGALAAVLSPAYALLAAIAAARAFERWPGRRPRWAVLVPVAGAFVAAAAVAVAFGAFASLGRAWSGHASSMLDRARVLAALHAIGDCEGPLAAVAALAGLAHCIARERYTVAAALGAGAFTALAAVASPALPPAVPIVSALFVGIAIGRLAALIHLPIGRMVASATAGFVLVATPTWVLAMH